MNGKSVITIVIFLLYPAVITTFSTPKISVLSSSRLSNSSTVLHRFKRELKCNDDEFACRDSCIPLSRKCDGVRDCYGGTDEESCERHYQFQCRDGNMTSMDKRCDGRVDCPDGSDETHVLCRNMVCPDYLFRCTYGACVDGTASCNGVQDCADNSDELQPKCRDQSIIMGNKFRCENGELIELYLACDGVAHCVDGTDEALRACAGAICPGNLFQCAYGACADEGADCNDLQECADGSDESDLLCNRPPKITTTTTTEAPAVVPTRTCSVRDDLKNGYYRLMDELGNGLLYLNASCRPGYNLVGDALLPCLSGTWLVNKLPTCVRSCKLKESESVVYRCLMSEESPSDGTRDCGPEEVEGTRVQPECRPPNYYSPRDLPYMFCEGGEWNYRPVCFPECGTLTPKGEALVAGGKAAERGDIPWHVGIYFKNFTALTFTQICGGSLISTTAIISAAHCFWHEKLGQLPSQYYAAAAGQLYRDWYHPHDKALAQRRDISNITLPSRFFGAAINYQQDLAVVRVSEPFYYRIYIRPVCLDFDVALSEEQLRSGNLGKVAGWGLTTGHAGSESPVLKVMDVPYVSYHDCVHNTSSVFKEFLAGDKICAGHANGSALCKGDSGGGLAFPAQVQGGTRYYLRGVVSTSPPTLNNLLCNLYSYTSFTNVLKHEKMIRAYWFI